ncbi:hypothetical protein D9V32_05085 [Mycetocola tolaasinivorans]|uniref:Uncharacterized protein n=1 Tax=Mycetocola tolaasinivorans TaxID=76635 RepID=A0A3L7ABG1_9MICO|nr:hypothetical protein [Mycetocola tolaasinivorans]RLP77001.1 hypothetical protein D9V32_05085 [Mycetocola tolaasinivorans]
MTDSRFPAPRAGMLVQPEPDTPIRPRSFFAFPEPDTPAHDGSNTASSPDGLPEPDTPSDATAAELDSLRESIHRDIDPHIQLLLRPHEHQVILDLIQVPYPLRGSGLANRALHALCSRADAAGWELALEPHPAFGSDTERLARWYGTHGFRLEEPGMTAWMHRPPRTRNGCAPKRTPVSVRSGLG